MKNNRYYLNCITFGRAREGLEADFQKQLIEMQEEIGFKYVRFHGLFHDDMAVYHEKDGNIELWFGYIDKLFDFLLENSLKPFVELSFMPKAIAAVPDTVFWWHANGAPPTDYGKWNFLVKGTIEHLIERYSMQEVESWYFEVWNEPNLKSFWAGTQQEYFKLYEETANTIKGISKALRVGGPSSSGADFREDLAYVKAFIKFCSEKKLPIDFFSAHPYPTYWPLDTEGNKQMGYMGKDICSKFIDDIKTVVENSDYRNAEIHLTEWNSAPSPRDLIHDTPFKAPFILYNITRNLEKINSLAYWVFTDIFEENGPGLYPFHGGFGLINADGIKKPSYWAYLFLSRLGDEVLEIGENYIICSKDDEIEVIMWNYCYYKDDFASGDRSRLSLLSRDDVFENRTITLSIKLDLDGQHEAKIYTLDESASALHNWIKAGGKQYLRKDEIEALKAESSPRIEIKTMTASTIEETLSPQEVKMYIIRK